MFAPTSYIGTDKVFWHLRISNSFIHISGEQWQLAKQELEFLSSSGNEALLATTVESPEKRKEACQRTIWLLDLVDEEAAAAAAIALERFVGCDYTLGIKCLNWEQLDELEAAGVSVESHTVNHPKLTRIDPEQARKELTESKIELEEQLRKEVKAICYPGGHFDESIVEMASASGYELGFITHFGFCQPACSDFQRMAIPRFDMRGDSKAGAERYLTKLVLKY